MSGGSLGSSRSASRFHDYMKGISGLGIWDIYDERLILILVLSAFRSNGFGGLSLDLTVVLATCVYEKYPAHSHRF